VAVVVMLLLHRRCSPPPTRRNQKCYDWRAQWNGRPSIF
jgi:hypothetical protein